MLGTADTQAQDPVDFAHDAGVQTESLQGRRKQNVMEKMGKITNSGKNGKLSVYK